MTASKASTHRKPAIRRFLCSVWSHSNKADSATNEFYNPRLAVSHKERSIFPTLRIKQFDLIQVLTISNEL